MRTPFQRDRDRIVHSKPFRRLKGKTQVFIDPAGDHYRTRMTHTLETTGIARVVARALRLNEDLVEAIGLGHDTGHPPFGHAGEEALDEALRERFGGRFRHNEQSLRIAERLNLTHEVRDGILTHTGEQEPETLEGKIVRIVDRVAYINHDIDDAIRYGILAQADLPRDEIARARPDRLEAHRHARPRPDRDVGAGRRHRPERRGRRGDALAARASCSSASTSGPETRAEHERARADDPAHLRRARRPRRRRRRDHRVHRRHDRPLRARRTLRGSTSGRGSRTRPSRPSSRRPTSSRSSRSARRCARPARGSTGRCPFHEERTPSFSVNPVDKLYYCFGCGKGGDMITFVRETQGLDFAGAIEWLADRFHIPLEYEDAIARRTTRAAAGASGCYALLDQAATFYERYLWDSQAGSLARDYLAGRGLGEEICREFRLGLALGGNTLARKAPRRASPPRSCAPPGSTRQRGDDYFQRRLALPARRRARPRARLPGAAAARGRPAAREVRQHARVGALPQGLGRSTGSTRRAPRSRARTARASSRATPT